MIALHPGNMSERVTFETAVEIVQPSGAVSRAWVEEQTLRAELVQEDAQSFLGSTERTEMRNVFRIWAVAWVTTDMRLVHRDYTYRIVRIVPIDRLTLELHCVNAANEPLL